MTHFISILLAILVTLMLASPAGFSKEAKKSGPSKPKATQETKKPAPKSDKEKGGIQYSPPQPKKEQAKKPYLKHCADVVYIRGDLREKRASEDRWLVAHEGTPDYLYDHLKTGSGSDSVATIEFVNGSQVGINKGTELLIESESSAKDVTERSFARKITLKAGTLWAKVRKAEAEENLQFHTRGGVIGVKGTELIIDATGETTTVDVLEGSVDYTRGGKTTTIQEGTTLEAKTSGELKTTKMDKAELRKQKEKQFEELSRAVSIAGSIPGVQGLGYVSEFMSLVKDPATYLKNKAISEAAKVIRGPVSAYDLSSLIKDPETYFKNRAISEVQSRVPVPVPLGGLFGGGKKEEPPPPPEPINLQIQGGVPVKTYFPTFTWTCLHGPPQQYRIVVSPSDILNAATRGSSGHLEILWEAVTSATSITYPKEAEPLRPGLEYYWMVIPEHIKDGKPQPAGKASQQAKFELPPPEPVNLQPSGGARVPTYFPTFNWTCENAPQHYRIIVSRSDTIKAATSGSSSQFDIVWEATTTGTSIAYPREARPLRPGLTYYWIVIPEQIKDGKPQPAGKVSQQAEFTLEEEKVLGKMVRASPLANFIPKGDEIVFDWTEPAGAAQYRIRISEQKDLSTPMVDQKVPFNYFIMEKWETRGAPKLSRGKTYYWQAEALDEAGNVTGGTDSFSFTLK